MATFFEWSPPADILAVLSQGTSQLVGRHQQKTLSCFAMSLIFRYPWTWCWFSFNIQGLYYTVYCFAKWPRALQFLLGLGRHGSIQWLSFIDIYNIYGTNGRITESVPGDFAIGFCAGVEDGTSCLRCHSVRPFGSVYMVNIVRGQPRCWSHDLVDTTVWCQQRLVRVGNYFFSACTGRFAWFVRAKSSAARPSLATSFAGTLGYFSAFNICSGQTSALGISWELQYVTGGAPFVSSGNT